MQALAAKRELYGIDEKYGLQRFPAFQFTDEGLLPGFTAVAPHIPRDISMAGVESFFTLKNPDLTINDDIDQTLSPAEWLASRLEPSAVIALLKYL